MMGEESKKIKKQITVLRLLQHRYKSREIEERISALESLVKMLTEE